MEGTRESSACVDGTYRVRVLGACAARVCAAPKRALCGRGCTRRQPQPAAQRRNTTTLTLISYWHTLGSVKLLILSVGPNSLEQNRLNVMEREMGAVVMGSMPHLLLSLNKGGTDEYFKRTPPAHAGERSAGRVRLVQGERLRTDQLSRPLLLLLAIERSLASPPPGSLAAEPAPAQPSSPLSSYAAGGSHPPVAGLAGSITDQMGVPTPTISHGSVQHSQIWSTAFQQRVVLVTSVRLHTGTWSHRWMTGAYW